MLSVSSGPAVADDYATAAELHLMEGFPPPADKQVNRSNALFAAPFNRWSYQHMRELYPSAGIPAADKVSKLKFSIDKGIDGLKFNAPDIEGEKTGAHVLGDKMVDMPTWYRETYKDAIVVIKGDEIVYEKYLNGMDGNRVHQMMSVTKSFAGLFGLMAIDAGEASENDPVTKYIPELKASSAFNGATFGQVLDMTNSMDFSEDYADPDSGIVHYATVLGLMEPAPGKTYADSIYEYLVTLPVDKAHPHGKVFHYQTPKTDVVNWTTNRATNMSFMDNFYQKLWSKIGACCSTRMPPCLPVAA
jgi:CubicO group peptidase (beta-lactamase class C family)